MDVDPDNERNLPRHQNYICSLVRMGNWNHQTENQKGYYLQAAGQGREPDDEICIYYWQHKVVWDAVVTLLASSLSGYMAHVALD